MHCMQHTIVLDAGANYATRYIKQTDRVKYGQQYYTGMQHDDDLKHPMVAPGSWRTSSLTSYRAHASGMVLQISLPIHTFP